MGNDDRNSYTLDGIKIFEDKSKLSGEAIDVDYSFGVWNGYERRNRVFMMSGDEPDVMQINYNWLYEYSTDGNGYYDLSTLDGLDLSGYNDDDLKYGTIDGKLNAIPIAYNSLVFYCNKDIYDSYGLDLPTTWEDLFEAAALMREDGIYPLGVGKKHLFIILIAYYEQCTGEKIFDESGAYVGDVNAISFMLSFYKKLMDEKVIPYYDDFGAEAFVNEKCAGAVLWASDADRYCESLIERGVNVVLCDNLTTTNPLSYGWYAKPATMYAISINTENEDSAAKFLDFLINDEDMIKLQGTEKGIPASSYARKILEDEGMLDGSVAEAGFAILDDLENTDVMIPSMEDSDVIDLFKNVSDKYIYNQNTLSECAEEFDESIRILLN